MATEERKTGWGLWKLRSGDKIRLTEGQPTRLVTRVSPSAAYYVVETSETYEVTDKKTGEVKPITRTSRKTDYISAFSFVEMIERGPVPVRVRETPAPVVAPKASVPRPELAPVKYNKSKSRKMGV